MSELAAAHLRSARFVAGVDAGRWRLISIAWPHALITISAAPREGAPAAFALRFELSGYPGAAPTGCPWDVDADAILPAARRPKGERVGRIFRTDWDEGRALYAPWDRVALATRRIRPREVGVHRYGGAAGWQSWFGEDATHRLFVRSPAYVEAPENTAPGQYFNPGSTAPR